jgi:catechol 2,3-dioxygenase-like lactoylglutathione lyase family enzyme
MTKSALEHINITTANMDRTLKFVQTAMPDWSIRNQGQMDWFGKRISWVHFGTAFTYLALQSDGQGQALAWQNHQVGVKHVGIAVDSIDETVNRLAAAGFEIDHWGGSNQFRRSVYFMEASSVQFEFIEYLTDDIQLRNQ